MSDQPDLSYRLSFGYSTYLNFDTIFSTLNPFPFPFLSDYQRCSGLIKSTDSSYFLSMTFFSSASA